MRLKMVLIPEDDISYSNINKHSIQGMVYELFKNAGHGDLHDQPLKLFCFGDVFPITDYRRGEPKTLLVSSPDERLIKSLFRAARNAGEVVINDHKFEFGPLGIFDLPYNGRMISGSPVLAKDKVSGTWAVPSREGGLQKLIERITSVAKKKYALFYGEEPELDGNLFDRMILRKEAAVKMVKGREEFFVVGTTWSLLEKHAKRPEYKFYKFLQDAGLGELTGMGFGFLNPLRAPASGRSGLTRSVEGVD